MTEINWPDLMRAGFGRLGLKPAEFWALSPGELMLMLGGPTGASPLTRDRLEALAAVFPDDERYTQDDNR